ncbi:unnamed protein product, partial [Vitis vinifera]|uniref:Uncharacterized protein n=1 Tax=Vitis vinifera TaxID=29760 RepID=D7TE61_VITVI
MEHGGLFWLQRALSKGILLKPFWEEEAQQHNRRLDRGEKIKTRELKKNEKGYVSKEMVKAQACCGIKLICFQRHKKRHM